MWKEEEKEKYISFETSTIKIHFSKEASLRVCRTQELRQSLRSWLLHLLSPSLRTSAPEGRDVRTRLIYQHGYAVTSFSPAPSILVHYLYSFAFASPQKQDPRRILPCEHRTGKLLQAFMGFAGLPYTKVFWGQGVQNSIPVHASGFCVKLG